MASREIGRGWHKEHDYTLQVGRLEIEDAAEGRRYWAAVGTVLRHAANDESSSPKTQGWPEQRFYGQTEGEALHAAEEAVKLWIDGQDDARWSGTTLPSSASE